MRRTWTRVGKMAVWGAGAAALAVIGNGIRVPGLGYARLELAAQARTAAPVQVAVAQSQRVVGVFAANIEELRARNHVTLIPTSQSQHTLAEMPAGSYAFVFAPFIAHSAPNSLRMYAHTDPAYFEVHKLTSGQAELAGYVELETQERLRKGLDKGERLTLYSSPWQKATNLTAIPLLSVKCARSRDLAVRRKGGTIVLFALDCKAI